MSIDIIKDISDIIPFYMSNPVQCSFILLLGAFIGYAIGRFVLGLGSKSKSALQKRIDELDKEKQELQQEINRNNAEAASKYQLTTINELIRTMNSDNGKYKIEAIIKLNTINNAKSKPKKNK